MYTSDILPLGIHRHSEDQIHMHETSTSVFIRVHVHTGNLTEQYPADWSTLYVDGVAPYDAKESTGTMKTKFICMKLGPDSI